MNELLEIPTFLQRPPVPAPTLAEARAGFEEATHRVPTMPRRTGPPSADKEALQKLGYPDWRIRSFYPEERERIITRQYPYQDTNDGLREWQAKMDESYKARKDR